MLRDLLILLIDCMEPPMSNRLANINDLRVLAKRLNLKLVEQPLIQPAILSSKQLKASSGQNLEKPFVELTTQYQISYSETSSSPTTSTNNLGLLLSRPMDSSGIRYRPSATQICWSRAKGLWN